MTRRTLTDLKKDSINGKKALVRVDFNVPLSEGNITDDTRIKAALPTIKYLKENGAKIILTTHLGRPKGEAVDALRVDPIAKRLESLIETPVQTTRDVIGDRVTETVASLQNGDILLLENLRFHKEEEENNAQFAESLSQLADFYVNDSFGTAHRAHASTTGVTTFLPSYAGLLLEKEIVALESLLHQPKRPFVAIIGGSKISTKMGTLTAIIKKADTIIIGGAMAYTLLEAQGVTTGKSLVEKDQLEQASAILNFAKEQQKQLILPSDHIAVDTINNPQILADVEEIPDELMGVDIGTRTIEELESVIKSAASILWNGPVGIFEIDAYAKGTMSVAKYVAECQGTTIIGGGDTIAALSKSGYSNDIDHICTGGGASLDFIEGQPLPALKVLEET